MVKNKSLSHLLLDTWSHYEKQVKQSRSHLTKKNIHKLRILTRQLEAILTLTNNLKLNHHSKNIILLTKKVRKSLGPLRDIQVQSSAIEEINSKKQKNNKYKELTQFLSNQKLTAKKKAKKCLDEISLKQERARIEKLTRKFVKIEARKTEKQIQNQLNKKIKSSIKELNQMRTRINPKRLKDIHNFRVYAKKLRYQGEFIKSLSGAPEFDLEKLKDVQSAAGLIQNDRVLLKTLDHFLSKKKHSKDAEALNVKKKIALHQTKLINKNFKELRAAK